VETYKTVKVKKSLWLKYKQRALTQEKTFQEVIEEALEKHLKSGEK
jgi:hypothetical protein